MNQPLTRDQMESAYPSFLNIDSPTDDDGPWVNDWSAAIRELSLGSHIHVPFIAFKDLATQEVLFAVTNIHFIMIAKEITPQGMYCIYFEPSTKKTEGLCCHFGDSLMPSRINTLVTQIIDVTKLLPSNTQFLYVLPTVIQIAYCSRSCFESLLFENDITISEALTHTDKNIRLIAELALKDKERTFERSTSKQ